MQVILSAHELRYPVPVEDWFTVAEVAAKLGLKSAGSVRVQIGRGALKAEKHGRDWFIHKDELTRYANENKGKRGNYDRTRFKKPRPAPANGGDDAS